MLSSLINPARIASAASRLPLANHRILFFGAGSAGVGDANSRSLPSTAELGGSKEAYLRCRLQKPDHCGQNWAARAQEV